MPFSRRKFVRSAATIAAVANTVFLPARVPAQTTTAATRLPLGLASYTFRHFNRAQVIAWMKQLGVNSINAKDVKDHLPADPAGEAQAVADYTAAGITIHAVGAIYFPKEDDDAVRSKFDYCRRAGASVMVVGDPTMTVLPRLEKFAREYDIRVAIHNHGPEDKFFPSPLDVLRVVKSMDQRMGCCIDVGHAARAGTDLVQAIDEVGPRLFDVHMKDLTDGHSKESQVAVGDGILPVPQTFAALTAIGYKGYVDLEYEVHEDDPMPGVSTSFAYMRGVEAGMAERS